MRKQKSNFGKGDATVITTKNGKEAVLLNPSQKAAKAAFELKHNVGMTNDGEAIKHESLSKEQRAYRSGYLDARKDSAKVYKAQQKK